MTRGGWGLAMGIGVGVAMLMTRGLRPVAKQAIKGCMVAAEGVQRATSGARENLQDIYAEAKAEREAEAHPGASSTITQP